MTHGLSAEQRRGLDGLVQRSEDAGQNWLTWLRQMPQAAKLSAMLRQTETVPDDLLAHLSPLGWEHVNLNGDYIWAAQQTSEKANGLRLLRPAPKPLPKAT